jgi:hypothetical protein
MMPFSTGLMAEFIRDRPALAVYWVNLLMFDVRHFAARELALREPGGPRQSGCSGRGRALDLNSPLHPKSVRCGACRLAADIARE